MILSTFFQISIGERTIESPFSERPASTSTFYQQKHSIFHPPTTSIPEEQKIEMKFQSSFARCLNLPPLAMDQRTWLENELLDTRQVKHAYSFTF